MTTLSTLSLRVLEEVGHRGVVEVMGGQQLDNAKGWGSQSSIYDYTVYSSTVRAIWTQFLSQMLHLRLIKCSY